MARYDKTELSPSPIRGYFRYRVPCGGIVTSVEARGFCGRANDVDLRLVYGDVGEKNGSRYTVHAELLKAECNISANVSSVIFEGTVIIIHPGGFLGFFLNPDCTKDKCFFQPAIINQTSNYTLEVADDHLVWTATDMSLLFSANITSFPGDSGGTESTTATSLVGVYYATVGVCVAVTTGLVIALLTIICVRRMYKVKEGEIEETHDYEDIPENLGTRAEIELQQNNAYRRNNKTTALFTEL